MPSAIWPLRAAVYAKLSGDAALSALITGVYDEVPPTGTTDYITLGPITQVADDEHGTPGADCDVAVNAWTREEGYKRVALIAEAVTAVLHRQPLTVTGWTKVSVAGVSLSEEGDPDPDIRRVEMIFRVWLTKEGV